jgi:hypothetical protein
MGMVTGEAEVWPGVGIHSTCADVTESIPLSFLYDAGTDGRLICLNLQSHKLMNEVKRRSSLRETRAYVIRISLFGIAVQILSSSLHVRDCMWNSLKMTTKRIGTHSYNPPFPGKTRLNL